jgi:hypothetical protein
MPAATRTSAARRRGWVPSWILVVALIVLPLFPFTVFVVRPSRPHAVVVVKGHRDAAAEATVNAQLADPVKARRLIKARRATRHLTPGMAVLGLAVPGAWVALFAIVGRRGFALHV